MLLMGISFKRGMKTFLYQHFRRNFNVPVFWQKTGTLMVVHYGILQPVKLLSGSMVGRISGLTNGITSYTLGQGDGVEKLETGLWRLMQ
ncbi:MAG: hypothetical protein BGO89_07100 [Candidatus Kapaibacterium thiocyanatum]|uniref:Uncharacterized protein n=1 Tax=Candidatus Kapaibacterium thiocyanatum TaxID=1895771 RepID=A0A1M3KZ07_9BACT|nr:MAG: hypothetical protein BGO89_07100 ['Candidatus Kapabacteria' thiocyanatum]